MVYSIIPDLRVLVPAHHQSAYGRVGRRLPVLGRAIPSRVFTSPPGPVLPVPPRLLGKPRLLTRILRLPVVVKMTASHSVSSLRYNRTSWVSRTAYLLIETITPTQRPYHG